MIEDVGTLREPHDGHELQLSIDSKIQFQRSRRCAKRCREHRAKAGAAVVLDVQTGEILALANLPTYNPNQRGQLSGAQLRNRVITDTFEPGSTMKPFTTALALENGPVNAADGDPDRAGPADDRIGDDRRRAYAMAH
jgi:cell division protein FtsI (penicillin-binding protein 3)